MITVYNEILTGIYLQWSSATRELMLFKLIWLCEISLDTISSIIKVSWNQIVWHIHAGNSLR